MGQRSGRVSCIALAAILAAVSKDSSDNRADREDWGPHVVAAGEDTVPGTGSRYLKSMYLVLNALENGNTDAEMGFALL